MNESVVQAHDVQGNLENQDFQLMSVQLLPSYVLVFTNQNPDLDRSGYFH